MDLHFPLRDHSRILGSINQKLSVLHCSFPAPFNICCSYLELFWFLGHKVQLLTPSFLVITYSVHVKQIVASFIILCFPSHSCSLCNVIVILLQHIIYISCVINSSQFYYLQICCAELQACFVVCKRIHEKLKSKCGNKLPQGWAGRMVWPWSSSPTLELTICFFSASALHLVGARKRRWWQCADAFDLV